MLDIKKTLTKVMSTIRRIDKSLEFSVLNTLSYTTSTTWAKVGNLTIPETGIYQIRASYSNASVMGIAYSLPEHTAIAQAEILVENTTGGTVYAMALLYGGQTYSFWAKCGTAGKTNSIQINKLVNIYD